MMKTYLIDSSLLSFFPLLSRITIFSLICLFFLFMILTFFYFMHRINCCCFQANRVFFKCFLATYLFINRNLLQYIFSMLMVIFQVSKEWSMILASHSIDIFKEKIKKTKFIQYPEFHVTNLQLNKLRKIQVSVTVSVMLFLMTLWD